MLQRTGKSDDLQSHGFLISVEVEDGVTIERLENAIGDALMWVEGTGKVDITHMGVIPEYEEGEHARPTGSPVLA